MTTDSPQTPSARTDEDDPSGLAARRVWIVTGKGGTGKTTLAAALATRAASHGRRALVVTAGGDGALPAVLGAEEARVHGWDPVEIAPDLWLLCIEPENALNEYMERQLHLGPLGRLLLKNRAFGLFLDAAPGWRDLVTLGKIWHLEQQQEGGRPRFDVIVVDAPATGHGLSFLSIPRVVLDTVGTGPLHRQTAAVQAMLMDSDRTCCVPVTLAEELPVRETLELVRRLEELEIAWSPVFVNRCEPALELAVEAASARLSELAEAGNASGEPPPDLVRPAQLAEALEFRARRMRQQRHWVSELEAELARPSLAVPYMLEPVIGRAVVQRLAEQLDPRLDRTAS